MVRLLYAARLPLKGLPSFFAPAVHELGSVCFCDLSLCFSGRLFNV